MVRLWGEKFTFFNSLGTTETSRSLRLSFYINVVLLINTLAIAHVQYIHVPVHVRIEFRGPCMGALRHFLPKSFASYVFEYLIF